MALMRDILSKTAHEVSDREYFARAHKIGTRATNVTMKKNLKKEGFLWVGLRSSQKRGSVNPLFVKKKMMLLRFTKDKTR